MRGLRTLQLWVPDTRRHGFAKEARRQSQLAATGREEREALDFIEALESADWWPEKAPASGEKTE